MSANSISTLSLTLLATNNLQNEQTVLAKLNEQLASGVKNDNLTDYSASDAQNLMNFQNAVTQKQAYVTAIGTVQTRLSLYDQTMTDMESIAAQAKSLSVGNQTYDPNTASQVAAQAQSYLKQVTDDLNQQIGGRFIYAGSRYSTQPVTNLSALGAPTLPFTATTSPTLPDYDTEYAPPGTTTDAAAFAQDSVTVDTSYSVQYGVTSNATGFQQLIAGLRLLNAGASSGSATTYQTDVAAASDLITKGLAAIQGLHAGVASNQNILTNQAANHNTNITSLQNQIGNIQQVDMTEVGTTINLLQTQLQASYSATASLEQLSIVKYL